MHTCIRLSLVSLFCSISVVAAVAAETRPGALDDLRVAKGRNHIAEAWLADATTRYRHFVLGAPYEAASVVAKLQNGRTAKLTLPEDSVFEDRQPRLADLDGDGRDEIVLVRSYLSRGAALAIVALVGDRLKVVAETPPTGSPHTWINPAGIADFDGDGRLDVAYVQMPHVLGRLRLWTLQAGKLIELAAMPDVSNHVAGSRQIGLAAVADFDGDGTMDLAIPSLDRRWLRFIGFKGGARELRRVPLPSPAVADFAIATENGKRAVVVGLGGAKKLRVAY
jgi:hypothetical protein